MSDVFEVSASFNANSYNIGDLMTVTISGNDVVTATNTVIITGGPLTIPIVAEDGAKTTVNTGTVDILTLITVAANSSVTIDTTLPIIDASSNTRVWTVNTNLLSVSAIA